MPQAKGMTSVGQVKGHNIGGSCAECCGEKQGQKKDHMVPKHNSIIITHISFVFEIECWGYLHFHVLVKKMTQDLKCQHKNFSYAFFC